MKYNQWDIWLAKVKFEDSSDCKKRPVLIVDGRFVAVVAVKMTSQPPRCGEYVLQDWKKSGLRKPTTVRISKFLQLTDSDFCFRIGKLSSLDRMNIEKMLPGLFE